MHDAVFQRGDVVRQNFDAARGAFDVAEAFRAWGGEAGRLEDGFFKFGRQRGFQAYHRAVARMGGAPLARHVDAVGSVRVDEALVFFVHVANGCLAVGVAAASGVKAGGADALAEGFEADAAACFEGVPEGGGLCAVVAADAVDVALKVARLADVHRRAAGFGDVCRRAGAVLAAVQGVVEDVVFVGGDDEVRNRQPHAFGDVAGVDVAEVAGGYGVVHLRALRQVEREVRLDVVHALRQHARPVDGVDRADVVAALVGGVGIDGFYQILAVVKDAFDGDVVDVRVLQAVHLRLLEGTHAAMRREHEDVDARLAAHRVFGGGAGVAAGRAEDVQPLVAGFKDVFHRVAEELHGDVLEGERGAVGEFEQVSAACAKAGQRGDGLAVENCLVVSAMQDTAQVVFRDVVNVVAHHREGEVGVAVVFPFAQGGGGDDCRDVRGHSEAAVRGEALQEDVAEVAEGCATGGLVLHGVPCGFRGIRGMRR